MEVKQKLEKHLQSLNVLSQEEIQVILQESVVESYEKGAMLLRKGQIQTKCFMVVEGCVREYTLVDGEEKTTAFYTEGDKITSYSSAGKNIPAKHNMECVEDCILTVSNQNFEDELRKLVPRLDAIIQQVAKEQLGKSKDEYTSFVSSSPEERYINLLENRSSLFSRVPQHQIASYIGIKPESLSRIRKRIHAKQKANSDSDL